jgi:hypothetical protein
VKQFHLIVTVLLLGAVLTLVVLVALGQVEIGFVRPPQPPPPESKAPKGPRIHAVPEAEKYYELLGYKACLYKYEGGWVDCWIEVDVDGKQTVVGEGLGEGVKNIAQADEEQRRRIGEHPSGYLLWVRRTEGNKEVWDLSLNVVSTDGKAETFSRRTGISPPPLDLAKGSFRGSGGDCSGFKGPLTAGEEITLATITNFGLKEDKSETTRTTKLKCKLAQ